MKTILNHGPSIFLHLNLATSNYFYQLLYDEVWNLVEVKISIRCIICKENKEIYKINPGPNQDTTSWKHISNEAMRFECSCM